MRDVLITLVYHEDENGTITPRRLLTPLAAPSATWYFGVGETGLEAALPSIQALLAARAQSSYYLRQQVNVDGVAHWFEVVPHRHGGVLSPDSLYLERYATDPANGAAPIKVTMIARHDSNGAWQTFQPYLASGSGTSVNSVRLVLDNGRPTSLTTFVVDKPPIEHFLAIKERSIDFQVVPPKGS